MKGFRCVGSLGLIGGVVVLVCLACASEHPPIPPLDVPQSPECAKGPHTRIDAHTPEAVVSDWGTPIRLGTPINTPCPEDAIEISRDGRFLYFFFTKDVLSNLPPSEYFSPQNATYRAERIGGPAEFAEATLFDLGQGVDQSLDGELSFAPDGRVAYFHSLRAANLGYQQVPMVDDILDVYETDIVGGEPGPGRNLGAPVNSIYADGEHALHPDGVTLYLASRRPGGLGGADIWTSARQGSTWTVPVNLGAPINSAGSDLQPAFTADGETIYFVSDRDVAVGAAIYRSSRDGGSWSEPELVIKGIVGEPSITADGQYLYFVHVLTDGEGLFDADVWYCERRP